MSTTIRALLALLTVSLLTLAMAACGGGDDDDAGNGETQAPGEAAQEQQVEPIERDPANEGKRITIGSKNFPEQYILGEIYAQALEAAGFDVRKQLDLGSEQVAFRAVRRGDVDGYPEYTGTALTSFYRVAVDDVPRDKDESFQQLQESLSEDNVTALAQTPFQNTYMVTSTRETAEKFDNPETLSELAERAGTDVSISGFPECRQRTDCYLGLERTYEWKPRFVSSEGQYEDLDGGQSDLTFGFSTDGPLTLDKYVTYEDDKNLFPPYFVTFLIRNSALERIGDNGREVIERVQEPLTEEVMRELNSRVSIDKQEPERVARDYLRESGFVTSGS
jgi:glycine betaine/choline ABC-type transport system substrate-binding protein